MNGRRRSPDDALHDDERELWSVFTKDIKPLAKKKRLAAKSASPPPPPRKQIKEKRTAPPPKPLPPKAPPPPVLTPLDRRARKRVASGRDAIDGRIDLHGMTQAEAHDEVVHFIVKACARDWRLVLVITGKGRGGGIGVLRQQVPHWLSLPELRTQIVGFEPAHISHGGEGALYVRLRRRRTIIE